MNETLIQTLDLQEYLDLNTRETFVAKLAATLSDTGFFFLRNHRIPEKLIRDYQNVSKAFFSLTESEKKAYEYTFLDHQVGYSPLGLEKGEYAKIPDRKEFFQVGDTYPFPYMKEIPDFAPAALSLFEAFRSTYKLILWAIVDSLPLSVEYKNKEGNSIMRSILYPADSKPPEDDEEVESEVPGGNALGMCSSRHTDIDMVTLLFARKPGLQLKYKGKYIPVTIPDPDLMIVNAGDMLEHLTGGRYVSGMHRVVCELDIERWSVPFFGHVLPETSIVPIFAGSDLKKYSYKTAGEYLQARLKQIGLAV
jgi:isopenicillin N synthase-like dioxygenase